MRKSILNSEDFESIPFEPVDVDQVGPQEGVMPVKPTEVLEAQTENEAESLPLLLSGLARALVAFSIEFLRKKTDDLYDNFDRQRHFRSIRREMRTQGRGEYWRIGGRQAGNSPARSKRKITVKVEIEE